MTLQSDPPFGPYASLRGVARFFVIFGWLAVLQITWDLFHRRIDFALAVLGLWIGPGLLRRSPEWRTTALVVLWIGFVFAGLAALIILFGRPAVRVEGPINVVLGLTHTLAYLGFSIWSYAVLIRPDVRKLFAL